MCSRWTVSWPSPETEQSQHISCLLQEVCRLSEFYIAPYLFSVLLSVPPPFIFLSGSLFALLSFICPPTPPPTCCCHRRLSLLGSEKECSSPGRDLTQRASRPGLRGAIYKWLLINPRPTLMLSHIFSFPSHAHLHELGCLGNRHAYRCEWQSVKILRFCQPPAVT